MGSKYQNMSEVEAGGSRRWLVLFIGLIALTAGCTFLRGDGKTGVRPGESR